MSIQTVVVFVGVAAALGVSLATAASGASMRAAGFVAIGFVPLMWALTHLIERRIGRDIWHYSAPYPYTWMDVASIDETPPATNESTAKEVRGERHSLLEAA
jgi:hypothetical protein